MKRPLPDGVAYDLQRQDSNDAVFFCGLVAFITCVVGVTSIYLGAESAGAVSLGICALSFFVGAMQWGYSRPTSVLEVHSWGLVLDGRRVPFGTLTRIEVQGSRITIGHEGGTYWADIDPNSDVEAVVRRGLAAHYRGVEDPEARRDLDQLRGVAE